jgi:hypothetical protein
MMRKRFHLFPPGARRKAEEFARQHLNSWVIPWVRPSVFCLSVPLVAALMFGGCPQKPVQRKFPMTGVIAPPRVTRKEVDTTPPTIDSTYDFSGPVLVLAIPPPKAPPVHRLPYPVEPEPEVKPEAPRISPQLSIEAKNQAQVSAEADIRAAQQSLDATAGRKLSANQQDLAGKIISFIKQAREAITAEDWLRAQSLAHKAKVLGDELIQSF